MCFRTVDNCLKIFLDVPVDWFCEHKFARQNQNSSKSVKFVYFRKKITIDFLKSL